MLLAAYVTDVATERYWGVLAAPGGVRTGLARLKKRVARVLSGLVLPVSTYAVRESNR